MIIIMDAILLNIWDVIISIKDISNDTIRYP